MVSRADISRITERHRLSQLAAGALVVHQMRAAFKLLDVDDLDGTFEDWLAVVGPIVQSGRTLSSQLASGYLSAVRVLKAGSAFAPVLAGPIDPAVLSTSMLVTGPVSLRSNFGRVPIERALQIAEGRSADAGMRHALNGGRETITQTVKADPKARGYQRVTSGNACEFCSMLAGRGGVYGAASADFEAHDRCGCSAEPIYA